MKKFFLPLVIFVILSSGMSAVCTFDALQQEQDFQDLAQKDFLLEELREQQIFQEAFLMGFGVHTLGVLYAVENTGERLAVAQAAASFPNSTEQIFEIVGPLPAVLRALEKHGAVVMPILWYEYVTEDGLHKTEAAFQKAFEAIRSAVTNEVPAEKLTPELERLLVAAVKLDQLGPNFLGRYEVLENGRVERIWTKSTASILENFLIGGLENWEMKYLRGESLTGWEKVDAAVDAAGIVALPLWMWSRGTKMVQTGAKLAESGKAARASKVVLRFSRALPKGVLVRTAKYGVAGLGAYLLVKHPTAVNSFLRWAAEGLGMEAYATWLIFGFWFVMFSILISLTRFLWRPAFWILRMFSRCVVSASRWVERRQTSNLHRLAKTSLPSV